MADSDLNSKSLLLKTFLTAGLSFGFLIALWDYLDEGKVDFVKIIFGIVFFGAFMAWKIVKAQKNKKTER